MIDFNYGIQLGPLSRENREVYRSARNDYSIWKWCRQNDIISEMQQEEWLEKQHKNPHIRMYEVLSGGLCVGVCGLTDIDHINQRAEFSLYIIPEHQGNGYGKLALKTLLAHGFKNLNFKIIWGESIVPNPAIEMFKKIGMTFEGTRRDFYWIEGEFRDAVLFSMRRDEFKI